MGLRTRLLLVCLVGAWMAVTVHGANEQSPGSLAKFFVDRPTVAGMEASIKRMEDTLQDFKATKVPAVSNTVHMRTKELVQMVKSLADHDEAQLGERLRIEKMQLLRAIKQQFQKIKAESQKALQSEKRRIAKQLRHEAKLRGQAGLKHFLQATVQEAGLQKEGYEAAKKKLSIKGASSFLAIESDASEENPIGTIDFQRHAEQRQRGLRELARELQAMIGDPADAEEETDESVTTTPNSFRFRSMPQQKALTKIPHNRLPVKPELTDKLGPSAPPSKAEEETYKEKDPDYAIKKAGTAAIIARNSKIMDKLKTGKPGCAKACMSEETGHMKISDPVIMAALKKQRAEKLKELAHERKNVKKSLAHLKKMWKEIKSTQINEAKKTIDHIKRKLGAVKVKKPKKDWEDPPVVQKKAPSKQKKA